MLVLHCTSNIYTQRRNKMFTPIIFVETLQNAKKAATNALIKDQTFNKAAHDFIDAQTEFAKSVFSIATAISNELVGKQASFFYPKKS